MNAGQLERVCGAEDCVAMPMGEKTSQAFDVARADLAAMRQPITDAALVADGWRHVFGDWLSKIVNGREYDIRLRSGNATDFLVDAMSLRVKGLATMYDLRELVRLLGGAQ